MNAKEHKTENLLLLITIDQAAFLGEQFVEIDKTYASHTLVSKYKELNKKYQQLVKDKAVVDQ